MRAIHIISTKTTIKFAGDVYYSYLQSLRKNASLDGFVCGAFSLAPSPPRPAAARFEVGRRGTLGL